MKYLKHMAVVKYEKLLIRHLALGGSVRDLTGRNLVGQQILAVWNKEGIQDMCAAQGITMENFCEVYAVCIERLMPNPCIKGGGNVIMLVPTLFLLEDWRIRERLEWLAQMPTDQRTVESFTQLIVGAACTTQGAQCRSGKIV